MQEHEQAQLPPGTTDDIAVLHSAAAAVELVQGGSGRGEAPREWARERPEEDDAELEELLIREITIDGMCGVY